MAADDVFRNARVHSRTCVSAREKATETESMRKIPLLVRSFVSLSFPRVLRIIRVCDECAAGDVRPPCGDSTYRHAYFQRQG